MPVYISRPHTILPDHKVSTSEIVDDILTHHPEHPRRAAIPRIISALRVDTRYFTQPLTAPTISGTASIEERSTTAFNDALEMATRAGRTALTTAGLHAGPDPGAYAGVDAIVTTHSTGWAVPNLDIHLIDRLRLAPTVRRIALTTLACAGGTQALIRAIDLVTARPGTRVLVVAAEVISSVYNHHDTSIEAMIYKALFGDSAAACIVSDHPLGPSLRIDDPDDTLEFVLPDSVERYSGRIDGTGFHFDSTKQALTAADDVLPTVLNWLGDSPVDFTAIHPGSPRIITDTATALGLDDAAARHSFTTLADEGNLGGVSILRVLERTHADPPPAGARGVVIAYGPGFAAAALRGTWHA
ncbi:PhlD (plasmid) [Streptomyces sp. QHH-9511]|uniref:PhlD n=1 Tax=Streptomyces sp. QHH-9511 TaxID=2684468 RepID=UPI0013198023|nr:PhlD [Streptomyces sp. QHH-9511]QGZ53322.1 PhlD [Streptomyces sp. QHH-9511]